MDKSALVFFCSISTQFTFNVGWVDFLYPIPTKQNAHRVERQVQDMYENNFTAEPVVIGIDHGFSMMKTKNHIFSNGVSKSSGKPPVVENSLYYEGNYYYVGGERKTVVEDKTATEDFFLLTLVAVAKELKTRGMSHDAIVTLGVGVPFKRFGAEAAKFTAYLKRSGIHDFLFEEEAYSIAIENVFCFPQCFAAVADRISNMEGRFRKVCCRIL